MTGADRTVYAAADASLAKQRVLSRIAAQRERIRARREAAVHAGTSPGAAHTSEIQEPLLLRAVLLAKQHPALVAAAVGVAMMAGPSRLVRWATIALPWVMRLRR